MDHDGSVIVHLCAHVDHSTLRLQQHGRIAAHDSCRNDYLTAIVAAHHHIDRIAGQESTRAVERIDSHQRIALMAQRASCLCIDYDGPTHGKQAYQARPSVQNPVSGRLARGIAGRRARPERTSSMTHRQPPTRRVFVDLSHVIEDGLVTYPGLPSPRICDYLSREASREIYAAGTEFQIASIQMIANTGTYLDCPFHRYAHGRDLAQIEPGDFADLDGIVIQADHRQVRSIDASWFRGKQLHRRAVLVHTGWDQYWTEPA